MKKELKVINAAVFVVAAVIYIAAKGLVFNVGHEGHAGLRRAADPGAISSDKSQWYYVSRVIDGDTIALSDGRKVRLIGVDTPEVYYSEKLLRDSKKSGQDVATIQALGRRASAFTRELCLGKKVRLEYDVDRKDRYKRTLAYVYLEGGVFVNAEIVRAGFAQVMTVVPNVKYAGMLLKVQKEAREAGRGLWKT
jgi:micrococcal nuclease